MRIKNLKKLKKKRTISEIFSQVLVDEYEITTRNPGNAFMKSAGSRGRIWRKVSKSGMWKRFVPAVMAWYLILGKIKKKTPSGLEKKGVSDTGH